MPAPALGGVNAPGVALMRAPDGPRQRVLAARNRQQVDTARHQTKAPDFEPVAFAVFGQTGQIFQTLFVIEKDIAPAIAPLRDVIGYPQLRRRARSLP